jgi:hypothetical protein
MPVFKSSSPVSQLALVALSLLLAAPLSGCRFGNRIEKAESVENLTGYYRAQASRLMFRAVLQPAGAPQEVREFAGNTATPPEDWDIFLTDPTGVAMDAKGPLGFLLGIVGDKGFKTPIEFTGAGQFKISPVQQEVRFTDSPPCTQVWTMGGQGKLAQTAKATFKDFPIRGNLTLSAVGNRRYEGDCTEVLEILSSCLQDINKCPGSTDADQKTWQNFVIGVYGPAIVAGGITAQDIETIQELGYTLMAE